MVNGFHSLSNVCKILAIRAHIPSLVEICPGLLMLSHWNQMVNGQMDDASSQKLSGLQLVLEITGRHHQVMKLILANGRSAITHTHWFSVFASQLRKHWENTKVCHVRVGHRAATNTRWQCRLSADCMVMLSNVLSLLNCLVATTRYWKIYSILIFYTFFLYSRKYLQSTETLKTKIYAVIQDQLCQYSIENDIWCNTQPASETGTIS